MFDKPRFEVLPALVGCTLLEGEVRGEAIRAAEWEDARRRGVRHAVAELVLEIRAQLTPASHQLVREALHERPARQQE